MIRAAGRELAHLPGQVVKARTPLADQIREFRRLLRRELQRVGRIGDDARFVERRLLLRRERNCEEKREREPAAQKRHKTNAKSRMHAHLLFPCVIIVVESALSYHREGSRGKGLFFWLMWLS